jgi:glycogen debranching enzyme
MIAEALGMDAEAEMWRRRSQAIVLRMIDDFWDEDAGVFRAVHDHKPVPVITPFNLYPLWTGQLPKHTNQRLVQHLTNNDEFWGEIPIPSVARNDQHFEPGIMWRGPVWVNINYFFIEALRQVGENDMADELTEKTLDLIMRHNGIYEYYDADTGKPASGAAEAFGWTAAVFIDLAISHSRELELPEGLNPEGS